MTSFSIVTNIAAINAQANLANTSQDLRATLTRVSSGLRINKSGDDAAGLTLANAFRSDIRMMNQGLRNANDGLTTLRIKDAALENVSLLIDRLATLATQAASGHTTDATRAALDTEFQQVLSEITREITVADLTVNTGFSIFISNHGPDGVVAGTISAVSTTSLTVNGHVLTSQLSAQSAIGAVASAVAVLGRVQGSVGSLSGRLTFAMAQARDAVTQTRGAESRIRDANMAQESATLTKYTILTQSGLAALAQANASAGAVLALLRR